MKERAFTLTETLIALALMAVLAVLAYTVIQGAIQRAAEVKCVSNLQTLGRVSLQYFSDNNGWLFPTKFWYRERFPDGIRSHLGFTAARYQDYQGMDSVMTCPELKRSLPKKFSQNNVVLNRCYSMNVFVCRYNPNGSGRLMPGSPQRLAAIPNPARMFLFTDGGSTSTESGEFQTTVSEAAITTTLLYPHRAKQYAVFFDGHVQALTLDQFSDPAGRRELWGDLRIEE